MAEGEFGESPRELRGEDQDQPFVAATTPRFIVPFDVPLVDKKLTFEEASKCLHNLGKDESGVRYAYLMITVTNRKLTDVSIILNFKHVMFVDLSDNFLNLDALQVLAKMPFLIMLKANGNRLESAALDQIPFLQVLSLNGNKVEETSDIAQPMLETLALEFNQIFTAQFNSEKLPSLKELDLKGNNLLDLSGSFPESLERLFVAKNKLTRLNDLVFSKFTNLTTLHLRDNKIRKLNGFSQFLAKLNYLNVRGNNIMKLRQFRKLQCLPSLEVLVYTDNPVEGKLPARGEVPGEGATENEDEDEEEMLGGEDDPGKKSGLDPVRIGVLVLLPNLKRINKDLITLEERDEAYLINQKKLTQIMKEESSEEETEPPTTTYTSEMADDTEDDELTQSTPYYPRSDEEGG